jgi:hypothetical protein
VKSVCHDGATAMEAYQGLLKRQTGHEQRGIAGHG